MIAVIGAGPAGLAAAWRAARAGHEVVVPERAASVGGMAGSFEVAGLRVDHGSHRLHPATPPHILEALRELLGDDLQVRPRNGRIRLLDRWIAFPLRSGDLLRRMPRGFAARAMRDAVLGPLRRPHDDTFAEVIRAGLGPAVLDTFYGPYAHKLWGTAPGNLAGELARRRVTASSPLAIARRLVRGTKPEGRTFLYPRTGFGAITEALADAAVTAGADLRLGHGVRSLRHATATAPAGQGQLGHLAGSARRGGQSAGGDGGDRSAAAIAAGTGLRAEDERRCHWVVGLDDGTSLDVGQVWSTAPLPVLARVIEPGPPPAVLDALGRLQHRAMVLLYLVVDRTSWTAFDAHYFPGPEVLASRVSEPRNYRDNPADPPDVTVLCAEIPCTEGDPVWEATDEVLADRLDDELAAAGLPAVQPVHVESRRLPRVYPIYRRGFADDLAALEAWARSLPGLITFGRQGLFTPDNTHHALAMGWSAADALCPDGTLDTSTWHKTRDSFRSYVVED